MPDLDAALGARVAASRVAAMAIALAPVRANTLELTAATGLILYSMPVLEDTVEDALGGFCESRKPRWNPR